MLLGDRLGILGLIVALLGLAATYLWPQTKWIGWSCLGLGVAIIGVWIFLEIKNRRDTCVATASSDVVARLYATGWVQLGTTEVPVSFQELFYEWRLTIKSKEEHAVTLEINNLALNDRMEVLPADSLVSELKPRWMSGFNEPKRSPDYYSRTVQLSPATGSAITIRRFLPAPSLSNTSLIRLIGIRSDSCPIDLAKFKEAEELARVNKRAATLASWKYSGADKQPPRLATDPGDVSAGNFVATVEARCDGDDCKKLNIRQLEVRKGAR